MGKNRSVNPVNTPILDNPSDELVEKMDDWQKCAVDSPSAFLSDEEISYVRDNMVDSMNDSSVPDGHLYRMERGYHFEQQYLVDEVVDVGSVLRSSSVFRSFSRESGAVGEYTLRHFDDSPVVIYRTSGHVPHYNITRHTHIFEDEKESWVETGKLKIDKIEYYNNEDYSIRDVLKSELNLKNYPRVSSMYDELDDSWLPEEVYVVDVSPA